MERSRVGAIVSARTGSARLPGKVMMPLAGIPLVVFLLRRIAGSAEVGKIVLATTDQVGDDALSACVEAEGFEVFRGSEDDLVERYVGAAAKFGFEYVVRVTADCPFVDAESLDYFVESAFRSGPFDLATTKGLFPVGIDYEMYSARSMELLNSGNLDSAQREHLTKAYYDRASEFRIARVQPRDAWRDGTHTYTVDTPGDYKRAVQLVDTIGRTDFSIADLVGAAARAD